MTQYGHFLAAAILGIGGLALVAAAAITSVHRTHPDQQQTGLVPTGWRYCPDEHRTRAAIEHPDGSATCCDCHTTIPAPEEAP